MYKDIIQNSPLLLGLECNKVLDIGTGNGVFLKALLANIKSYNRAIGCDVTKEILHIAREKLKDEEVTLLLADGAKLPFLDEEFDLITISNSLHHFENVDKVIREVYRVLKEDGLFVINEMIHDDLTETQLTDRYLSDFFVKVDKLQGKIHNFTLSKEEVKEFFNGNHLSLLEENEYDDDCYKGVGEESLLSIDHALDKKVDEVAHTQEYKQLLNEVDSLKNRMRKIGIDMQKQLFLLYRKEHE
ncbi:class I SAM-dependent methyltransferase [Vallitalea okinawensis]|uniref:class I SAM-dependent methyltransferase n=1 Tax=Vallitalea okinawensis TaxID=2078660 RepID=UPI000CFC7299|nr:class I SAM-dependent methyltransferase [Vallitalea okinawensis]